MFVEERVERGVQFVGRGTRDGKIRRAAGARVEARAIEMLFERLAVSWTISDIETSRAKDLLARYRMATAAEREFVLDSLRTHLAENFPELEAP